MVCARGQALGDRLLRQRRGLDTVATTAGILLADMPDHLDFGRLDIQLFRDHLPDFGQGVTIMRTDQLVIRQIMDDLYAGWRRSKACTFLSMMTSWTLQT